MRCDISFPKKFDKLNFTIKLGTLDGYVEVKMKFMLQLLSTNLSLILHRPLLLGVGFETTRWTDMREN
jgi:hypothetical protein